MDSDTIVEDPKREAEILEAPTPTTDQQVIGKEGEEKEAAAEET